MPLETAILFVGAAIFAALAVSVVLVSRTRRSSYADQRAVASLIVGMVAGMFMFAQMPLTAGLWLGLASVVFIVTLVRASVEPVR